ncbi:MAG: hypothetical protein LBS41_03570 [Streptococcaceae bacterium]|jgi:hypothetical protein|nr:hypothetical protein [Streptococcaceae bacterium]
MSYTVQVETITGQYLEKTFDHYREAMCFATNYYENKMSKILKQEQLVNEFRF